MTEGFQAVLTGAPQDFKSFQIVANAAGPIDPPGAGAVNFQGFPTPQDQNPDPAHQASGQQWAFHAGGGAGSYASFLSRAMRGDNFDRAVLFDFAIRFTARGSWASHAFSGGRLEQVPLGRCNIGLGTPTDPSVVERRFARVLGCSVVGGVAG